MMNEDQPLLPFTEMRQGDMKLVGISQHAFGIA